jgi:hypothetical protein
MRTATPAVVAAPFTGAAPAAGAKRWGAAAAESELDASEVARGENREGDSVLACVAVSVPPVGSVGSAPEGDAAAANEGGLPGPEIAAAADEAASGEPMDPRNGLPPVAGGAAERSAGALGAKEPGGADAGGADGITIRACAFSAVGVAPPP